jgi:two-component system, LytTR family, response regulator
MNKLGLLVVDDEPLIRRGICKALSSFEDINVIAECGSGTDAVQAISAHRPDLVLLDVQMPDFSGLEVIRRIGPKNMPLTVFITAYDEYAVQAFELNAVDYLLKPFDEDRFRESLERARMRLSVQDRGAFAKQLESLLSVQARKPTERIVVHNGDRYDFVPIDSIDWIESANNYVELHCGTKQYLLGETLSHLEGKLDGTRFLRIHRSRIVNTARIIAVHPLMSGSYQMELRNGVRLTTGRQYKDAIQHLIRGS